MMLFLVPDVRIHLAELRMAHAEGGIARLAPYRVDYRTGFTKNLTLEGVKKSGLSQALAKNAR